MMDSIRTTTIPQAELRVDFSNKIDTIQSQIQAISEYGIGYSDVVSHITMPLIIALFAVAVPFLFTVISDFNHKYESDNISQLFSSERSYKWFRSGAYISAFYLVTIGVITLCLKGVYYKWWMLTLDWTSIVMAGGYSFIILWFIGTCIKYFHPQRLVERIEDGFRRGVKEVNKYLKRLKRKEKRASKEKLEWKRGVKKKDINIGRSYAYYGIENARTKSLIELCKYAFIKQDYSLFLSVYFHIKKMYHPEQFYKKQQFVFFEGIVDTYLFNQQDQRVKETVIRGWFLAFKESEFPDSILIYRMLGKMVSAVRQGKLSVFEQYIHCANYGYSFINSLPIVCYVRGGDEGGQKRIDKERQKMWRELCEMHYIALAHLFSSGCYEAVKIVFSWNNIGYRHLFPNSVIEALNLYSRCKEKQGRDGMFSGYWYLKEVVGENVDSEMLEKLTSFILLIVPDASSLGINMIGAKRLQILHDTKGILTCFAKTWQDSAELCSLFPQIKDVHFEERFNTCIEKLEMAERVERKINDGGIFDNIGCELREILYKDCPNKKWDNIYQLAIPEYIKKEVKLMFRNILYGNFYSIVNELVAEISDDKTERIPMGDLYIKADKHGLMSVEGLFAYRVFNNLLNIFKSRYLFMVYSAISKMKLIDVEMPIDKFEDYFVKEVGENGSEYVMIDSGSHWDVMYSSSDRKFHGAEYHSYDLNIGWYFKDVEELDLFMNTILIIRKIDLPAVISTSLVGEPDVVLMDESEWMNGVAEVGIRVNPNYEIRYSPNAKVLRIKLGKMSGK